jgi:Ca2+-binding RTX toxin-like protein
MDNDDSVTYRNVVIEDNVIQTGMPRGITIEQVDGVTIANNVALAVDGSAFRVAVNVIDAVNATVTNTTTNGLILSGTVPVVETSNAIITQQVSAGHRITKPQIESLRAEADIIRGTDGADRMNGTNRNDVMIAGGGNDTISGGRGDDMIIGGGGNNVLVGGSGADTFVFSAETLSKLQSDRLMDLNFADGDKLEFNDFGKSVFDRLKDPSMFNNSDFDVVSIDSASDLASLARLDTVNASRRGTTDTLVLKIADSDGDMLELQLSNMFNQFVQAGGQIG